MNIKSITTLTLCSVVFLNYSTSIHAKPIEACFSSPYDYELYQKHGDNAPPEPSASATNSAHMIGVHEASKLYDAWKHGPAKRKNIVIKTNEISVNGKPYMDVSESTTPSGEKSYFWQAVDEKSIMDSTSKLPLAPAGTEYLFNLTVSDPVCETKVTKQLKLHIH